MNTYPEREEVTKASEQETSALIGALKGKLGDDAERWGRTGNSPYSDEFSVWFRAPVERGTPVEMKWLARSHDGAGHYKGRGRSRYIGILAPASESDVVICLVDDAEAKEIGGCTGVYVRPRKRHEAEVATGGLGTLADIFGELKL